jgi:hypothetical protein
MIDLNHKSGYWPGRGVVVEPPIGELMNAAIDAGLARQRAKEPRRDYLGASQLGDPCTRKLVYQYKGYEGTPPRGLMLRVFAAGHAFEALTIEWLRLAGFDVRDRDGQGRQFRFTQARGRISGSIDGIIASGPVRLPYPLLFEHKAVKAATWNKFVKHGVAGTSEVYEGQAHLYMGYLKLANGLFCAMNKDTEEYYWELMPFNLPLCQKLSDRAVDILRMAEFDDLPPRIAAARDHYWCRMCDFAKRCWT